MAVAWASPLVAQDQAAALRRVEARLDSVQAVARRRDSLSAAASANDTVVVGGLRVAIPRELRPIAQAAAAQAWGSLERRFGASVAAWASIPVLRFGDANSSPSESADTSEVARAFEQSAAAAIWRQQDPLLTDWLRGNVPGRELSASEKAGIVQELVVVPARSNLACHRGEAAACAVSLGLRVGPDTLAEWYPPGAWPRLAGMVGGQLSGLENEARRECEATGNPAACRAILTPGHVLWPVSVGGRRLLVQEALDAGGVGAFERLTAASGRDLGGRLASAAGIPLDSLLGQWSAVLRTGTTHGPARPTWELLLAAAWSALLLVATLGGSRWR